MADMCVCQACGHRHRTAPEVENPEVLRWKIGEEVWVQWGVHQRPGVVRGHTQHRVRVQLVDEKPGRTAAPAPQSLRKRTPGEF